MSLITNLFPGYYSVFIVLIFTIKRIEYFLATLKITHNYLFLQFFQEYYKLYIVFISFNLC